MKKYILFVFGFADEQFVLETLADLEKVSTDIRFVTGNGYGIYHFESKEKADDIKDILVEYLEEEIQSLFLFALDGEYSIEMEQNLKDAFLDVKFNKEDFQDRLKKIKNKYLESLDNAEDNEEERVGVTPLKELLKMHLESLPERQLTVNDVLDKILEKGLESLTERERDFLDNQKRILDGKK